MDQIREHIARWISPKLAQKADKHTYLWHQVDDCYRWLSEFKEISIAMDWLKQTDANHWRGIGDKPVGKLPSRIQDFREYLRRGR